MRVHPDIVRGCESLIAAVCLFGAIALPLHAAEHAAAGQSPNLFAGCDRDAKPAAQPVAPRDRLAQHAPPTVDRITQRAFASFSLDDLERGVPGPMSALCWARLDGVWRETGQVTLDRNDDPDANWGSDVPELASIANGTYTTPGYLVIAESPDPARVLRVADGLSGERFVEFRSDDGVALEDVMRRGGRTKLYRATSRFEFGEELVLDVTRTGRARLSLGPHSFLRPSPGVSQTTMASQVATDDAFLLSYNLENLAASRRGYDIVTQDPFFLLQNPKFEVFAKVDPKKYYITEKRTVPVGFSLVQEITQGTVYRKSLVSSEREVQQTLRHTFGIRLQGSAMVGPARVSASAAYEASRSTMNSLRQSQSVAQAVGYSRAKQYALTVDHPYITLSDAFVDAVEDARRHGRYRALIDRFGTHYPYAVTYGAAAKMTQSFSERAFAASASRDKGFSASAGARVFGTGGSSHFSRLAGKSVSTSGSIGSEGASFVAVGGNGSWDQNGYSAGSTPYPILLDLRPLTELLNPMNFPGEPEIYVGVRRNLEKAIADYINGFSNGLSDASLLPTVVVNAPAPAVRYKAIALGNGKCLDVQGDARQDRAPLRLWDCNGTPNQQFMQAGNQLINARGLCVDAARPTMDRNGGALMLWRCHGGVNQRWSHLNTGQLRNGGGKCMDAHAPTRNRNGGKVHLWECQRGDNQRWALR